jgi:hypothetical protein
MKPVLEKLATGAKRERPLRSKGATIHRLRHVLRSAESSWQEANAFPLLLPNSKSLQVEATLPLR